MIALRWKRLAAAAAFLIPASAFLAADEERADKPKTDQVVINIVGDGQDAKYIKEGATSQAPVEVTVGQSVIWRNMGDRKHTATSKMKVDGKYLFDTDQIPKTKSSSPIAFDEDLYKKAGGKPGGEVKLEYLCSNHPTHMMSIIVLKAGTTRKSKD